MPKKRGPKKKKNGQQSSAKHSPRNTKDENTKGFSIDPQETAGDREKAQSISVGAEAISAVRLEEEDVQQDSKAPLPNGSRLVDQPSGDVEVQESWLENLPELTELILWKVSEVILPDRFMSLGLKLGLPQIKLEMLLAERSTMFQWKETTFNMLYQWYNDQVGDPSKFLFQVLTTDEGLDQKEVFNLLFERTATGRSVDVRFKVMVQWKKEQTAQIDQVETLARILEACHERRKAYKIRQNHLGVTNERKKLLISEDQPKEGVAEVQLNVTHSNQLVREEAQGKLQALLDASSSDVSLVPSTGVGGDFLEGLKSFTELCKPLLDVVRHLERSIGRDGFYKPTGLTVDSIHFHVKVYTIEGLRLLQSDVQSGRIGHQLGMVLISEKTKQEVGNDIVLDVALEGSGAWDLLSHAVIDPIIPSSSLSTSTEKAYTGEASKEMKDWTEVEVAIWLKSYVGLSDVSKFEGVDGFTLVRCTKAELIEDFKLSAGYCKKLMVRREHYLEKEGMGMLTTPESPSSHSRDGNSKVSAMDSVTTPSPVAVEPTPFSAILVSQGERMHKTSSSSPMGNIHVDSKGVEVPGKKQTTAAPSVREVTVASLKMEQDTVESIVDMETAYGSSYASATPNPSVDLPLPVKDSERKLTNLLLGSDKGELDSSYYPVLVVNTPAQQMSSAELEERFGFMSSVSWNVVFDCNADSNKTGLCQYVNQKKSLKILSTDNFTETKNVDALREDIDFPEIPVWVFPNGRNDVNVQGMDKMLDMDWMRERSHAVLNTVRFFSDPGVIPPGRAVVVFFLLSYSDIMVMTQLFREFYTYKSFQDLKRFTVIAENQSVLHKWIQHLESQSIVSSKDMNDRCLGGVPWQEINTYMLRLLGSYKDNRETLFIAKESSTNYPFYVNELDDVDEGPVSYDI
eukprot:XP_011676328.1 PREDICTED: uncharacterized protein LOC105444162 [Strongylocentrotus purpuratus]